MATVPAVPTLSEVVNRAVTVCDPNGDHEGPAQFLERFHDDDEPIAGEPDVEMQLAEEKGAIDPRDEDPAVVVAAAASTCLAHRRTELGDDREGILRLAARAEFDGSPPPEVRGRLGAEGVQP